MSAHTDGPSVVAAVDGTDPGYAAVRYAVGEAVRLGARLQLVNVVPGYLPVGPRIPVDSSLRRYAHSVLDRGVLVAIEAGGHDLRIETRLLEGGRVASLVDQSEDADLLVLGAHHGTVGGHVWTGSTITGVCARSECPVVVVPAEWDPTTRYNRVVVGFKSPKHAEEQLAAAFELAQETGSELMVLHAWKLQGAYDDIVVDRVGQRHWELELLAGIQPVLADFQKAYPQVKAHLDVAHDQPAHALVALSAEADRLVLVRPAHGGFAHHLGSTARAVLRDARCPVEVVPPVVEGADTVGLEIETAGELLR